ncbi:membrane protein insertion efficiency factor YidD [Magnetococcales bacterium HHB-1]
MLKKRIIRAISWYQREEISKKLSIECNFTPSCSEYSKQAIEKYGLFYGTKLAFNRIRRCNDPNGYQKISDPLPEKIDDHLLRKKR